MKLSNITAVRQLLASHGFRIKKGLGQNFLVDHNILQNIVKAADVSPGDLVLEIGPGIGALTQVLAQAGAGVIAIEIDSALVDILQETMAEYPQVQVVAGDALRLNLAQLLPADTPCRVVANLPYYITSPLLMKLCQDQLPLTLAVVMIQREVAERILATPGSKEYGALSVTLAYYVHAEMVSTVSRRVFFPQPNVDSAVIRLTPRPFPYPAANAEIFTAAVRAAFAQRRKTLRNSLRAVGYDADAILLAAGIDGGRRGETLNLQEFGQLSLVLANHISETPS